MPTRATPKRTVGLLLDRQYFRPWWHFRHFTMTIQHRQAHAWATAPSSQEPSSHAQVVAVKIPPRTNRRVRGRSRRKRSLHYRTCVLPLCLLLVSLVGWFRYYRSLHNETNILSSFDEMENRIPAIEETEDLSSSSVNAQTVGGYAASLVACLAFGSFAVPIKTPAMRKIPVDPLGKIYKKRGTKNHFEVQP